MLLPLLLVSLDINFIRDISIQMSFHLKKECSFYNNSKQNKNFFYFILFTNMYMTSVDLHNARLHIFIVI